MSQINDPDNLIQFNGDILKYKSKLLDLVDEKGFSVFYHLSNYIKRILPLQKSVNFEEFENVSKKIKEENKKKGINKSDYTNPALVATAKIQEKLFIKNAEEDDEPVAEENEEHPLPNILEIAYYFEKAGVGLSQKELTLLSLSIKSLVNTYPVKIAKLWGKIFGLYQNYYIIETEFGEGEDIEEEENVSATEPESPEVDEEEMNEDNLDKLPKSKWKPPVKVPREQNNTGVNKKVYYVCNEPGFRWIRLPPITPEQIVGARSIQHLFTGILDSPVSCYPPFSGTEANYLRAQIARISASTQISPAGYYNFGDDEEDEEELDEDEEGGERQNYEVNLDYEPLPLEELADQSTKNWVHQTSYILPQGRVQWWNPDKVDEFDEFDEDEEADDEDEVEGRRKIRSQPERGPPILTSIASDLAIFGQKPWSIYISSDLLVDHAVVVVSSNLWPGAKAVAWGKRFENIYIGWGLKSVGPGFQPQLPPMLMTEYQENGAEMEETKDPTPEDEAALRAALNPPDSKEEEGEDDEGEGGDDEDGQQNNDDDDDETDD